MRSRVRLWRLAAGVALLAACSLSLQPASGQSVADQKRAARGEVLLNQNSGGPDLISGPNGEPILRYPVAHWHAMSACLGWLYISRDTIKRLADELAPLGFIRIERSLLVNIRSVLYAETVGRATSDITERRVRLAAGTAGLTLPPRRGPETGTH
jgi:hypothetical protein